MLYNVVSGDVRNLGKPVGLCKRYYDEGADEVISVYVLIPEA